MGQAENYAVASRLVAAKTAAAQNADEDGEEEIAPVATKGTTITRPSELLDAVLQSGRKGLSIQRSEEHTSELQSLMRISYVVLCLKKTIEKRTSAYQHILIVRR